MNRDQKAATIEALATEIDRSEAIFAVDYRGLSVPGAAELRAKLRDADATFTVVKNSLTERAADQAGAQDLKAFLTGPTALTFVRGDIALAAKAISDYARATDLLPFKGGLMNGGVLEIDQIRALSRLPSREVLYGQLVGVVASPVTGLVRSLNALISGLAVALGQVQAKKETGEIPSGEAPAKAATEAPAAEEAPAEDEAPAADEALAEDGTPLAGVAPAEEDAPAEEPSAEETPAEQASTDQAEPAEPAQDDNKDASEQEPDSAEATKED
jgi:large subunit ribosomal protein L10